MFRFSLVGFLTSGIFLGRAYFDYLFSMVACVAALERVASQRWQNSQENTEETGPEPFGDGTLLAEGEVAS
jgi:hypothetical protein